MTSAEKKNTGALNRGYPPGLSVIRLDTVPSTNNHIKDNMKQLLNTFPVMVIAPIQTGGRGRENRTWLSKINLGLYVSFGVLIHRRENISLLSSGAAVSVINTLCELIPEKPQLKWPNDIMFGSRKTGGILIENVIRENDVVSVIGIGLNLNHHQDDFPPELSQTATSVKLETGMTLSAGQTARDLAGHLLDTIKKINTGAGESIIRTANRYCDSYLGKEIHFSQNRKMIRGVFRGIHRDGGLILETGSGIRQVHYTGEIQIQS